MKTFSLFSAVALALTAHAAEYFVDPAKGLDTNPGTAAAPFATVRAAIKAAAQTGGDTVTLKGGTYREAFSVAGVTATAERPFVIQGAAGERAIVTGFEPVTSWQDAGNGVYTAEVPELINGLFVGLAAQPVARWPRTHGGWMPFGGVDSNAMSFAALNGLGDIPAIQAIAEDPRSAQMLAFICQPNVYNTYPVKAIDLKAGKVSVTMPRWWPIYTGKGDTFALQNHPLLVAAPGDWSCSLKEEGGKAHTVHFKPAAPADLTRTCYRTRGNIVSLRESSGVVIRNLEVSGAGRTGIAAWKCRDTLIEGCTVHNAFADGIETRLSANMTVRGNITVNNELNGICVASTDGALVEGNEVCFNQMDGLRVMGNVSGRPGAEPDSTRVTVRRNYAHHHYHLSHPDNMQTFRGVTRLAIEDNLFLYGGQNTMTEENTDSAMRGNVSLFTSAYITIFGHGNAHRWVVEGNTFGHGGWGAFAMDGSEDHTFRANLFIGTGLSILPDTKSDHNAFVTRPYAPAILYTGWRGHNDLAAARAATGTDAHSIALPDAPFKNMPKAFGLYERMDDPGNLATPAYLPLRTRGGGGGTVAKPADFAVGDNIEVNGDGALRKVTAVDAKGIAFAPPLPQPPFRDAYILNWGAGTSAQLDLGIDPAHPLMTAGPGGGRAGSPLDIAAFQRGELLEKGKRTLPAVPPDLRAAWPDPNFYIPPMHGR
ncbi:MAG: right-handed parallel beta-helix repeat-containing protein [Kiritimatiellaeota bacterium]|nr:right-handed parallel beta-helix repeat-containing protein [Kiritimatiellota bacterium]